jgi:hypothetical protein
VSHGVFLQESNVKTIVENWRTSLAGLGISLGALSDMAHQASSGEVDPNRLWTDVTALIGAAGLLFAKDAGSRPTPPAKPAA